MRFDDDENISEAHGLTGSDCDRHDMARGFGDHVVLHLHRLENGHDVADTEVGPNVENPQNRALQRRANRLGGSGSHQITLTIPGGISDSSGIGPEPCADLALGHLPT